MSSIKEKPLINHKSLILRTSKKLESYSSEHLTNNYVFSPSLVKDHENKDNSCNFVIENKKNLKNFFSDRIPQDHCKIISEKQFYLPTEIMTMRKIQYQKQQMTKIKFHKSIDMADLVECSVQPKNIHVYFRSNEKSQELMQKNNKDTTRNSTIKKNHSSSTNYQTPTENSMVKYRETLKNKAYNSVFGEQHWDGEIVNKEATKKRNTPLPQKKQRKSGNDQVVHQRNQQKRRQKLHNVMEKLQNFNKNIHLDEFDFPIKTKRLTLNPEKQQIQQKAKSKAENQILEWVKSASQSYKKKIMFKFPIKNIQDIEKVDSIFYKKMVVHKKNRLLIRRQALSDINLIQRCKKQTRQESPLKYNQSIVEQDKKLNGQPFASKQLDLDLNGRYTHWIPHRVNHPDYQPITPTQKFQKMVEMFMRYLRRAKLYNIKKQNIPNVFWKKRTPFQLEGSYVMFKLIKTNNTEMFCKFMNRNQQYIQQIDQEYRTCLTFAVQNNATQIVDILLKTGVVDIDFQDINGETALMYAIENNNYPIVQNLLKTGAYPWSTANFNMSKLMEKCNKKIKIAVKNARKIYLGRTLNSKLEVKDQFWNQYKNKIQGDEIIKFY